MVRETGRGQVVLWWWSYRSQTYLLIAILLFLQRGSHLTEARNVPDLK